MFRAHHPDPARRGNVCRPLLALRQFLKFTVVRGRADSSSRSMREGWFASRQQWIKDYGDGPGREDGQGIHPQIVPLERIAISDSLDSLKSGTEGKNRERAEYSRGKARSAKQNQGSGDEENE